MRWLIALIIVLLAVYHFWPEPEPVAVEDSFIAAPVQVLRQAEGLDAEMKKANEARRRQLEEEIEKQSGGG